MSSEIPLATPEKRGATPASDRPEAPAHAVLDMLKPPEGYRATHAVIFTFSLDLVIAAAALGKLAGFGDQGTRVSRVSLATALRELREGVRFVHQAGRLRWPNNLGPFHALLLDHVTDARGPTDETCFHPKLALVRFAGNDDEKPVWRLWLGSRNFVRSQNWELGGIVSTEGGGRRIPGLGAELEDVFDRAGLPVNPELRREMANLRWNAKEPERLEEVRLPFASGVRWRSAAEATEAIAVSPFLDAAAVTWMADHLPERPRLVTTQRALEKLARGVGIKSWEKVGAFELHLVGEPSDQGSTLEFKEDEPAAEDEGTTDRGLHAKALFLRLSKDDWRVQFGSANATGPGLALNSQSGNVEVVASVRISDIQRQWLLGPLLDSSRRVSAEDLAELYTKLHGTPEPPEADAATLLAEILASLRATQAWSEAETTLTAEVAPASVDGFDLFVRPLLSKSAPTRWMPGTTTLTLAPVASTDISDYVVTELRPTTSDQNSAFMLLRACSTPGRTMEGTDELFRRALGPAGVLEWIRGALDGSHGDTTDWDTPPDTPAQRGGGDKPITAAKASFNAIPLESILRAYARSYTSDRNNLDHLDAEIRRLGVESLTAKTTGDSADDQAAREHIAAFLVLWNTVRATLVKKGSRR